MCFFVTEMWCIVLWCTLFSVKSTQFFYFRSCKTIHHTTNGTHEITKKTRKTHLRSDLFKSRAARSRAWGGVRWPSAKLPAGPGEGEGRGSGGRGAVLAAFKGAALAGGCCLWQGVGEREGTGGGGKEGAMGQGATKAKCSKI